MPAPWEEYQAQAAPAPAAAAPMPWEEYAPAAAPAAKPSTAMDMLKSAGSGLASGAIGLGTMAADIPKYADYATSLLFAKGAEKLGLLPAGKTANDLITDMQSKFGAPDFAATKVQNAIEGVTGPFHQPQSTEGKYAKAIGEFIPGTVAGGGAVRGLLNATTAGIGSEFAADKAAGTPYELPARIAGAMLGGAVPSIAARAVTPLPMSPGRAPLVATLDAEGVPLTAGQRTGNKTLQWLESTAGHTPGGGGGMHGILDAQKEAFTSAALGRAGIDAERAMPNVMQAGRDSLNTKFADLASRNTLQMDNQFYSDLLKSAQDYTHLTLPTQRLPAVQKTMQDLVQVGRNGGLMDGDTYQALRSSMTKQAETLKMSDPPAAQALRDMRGALDSNMTRSISPADAEAWSEARRQWGNLKDLTKAAGGAGEATAEGLISPAQLRTAIASGNRRTAYVNGQGDLSDLARAGVGVMAPLPNSGTVPRAQAHSVMAAPGAAIGHLVGDGTGATLGAALMPLASAGAVAGTARAITSPLVQQYLANQAIPRTGLLGRALDAPDPRAIGLLMLANRDRSVQPAR